MKHKLVISILAVVVVVGLAVAGCAKPAPAPAPGPAPAPAPAPAPPAGPEEIRWGCSAPMTGHLGGFGEGCAFGAKAAVEDINKQGGIYVAEYDRKLPVKLIIVDNASDMNKAGILAEQLVLKDKIHAFCSLDTAPEIDVAICTIADRYKIPNVIGGGPLEPWLHNREASETHWQYTWFTGFAGATPPRPGDFRYGKPGYMITDTWVQELDSFAEQTNKVAGVFATDDTDGNAWYPLLTELLQGYGFTVIGGEDRSGLFPLDATDLTPLIKEWKDNDVQVLWGIVPGPNMGTLLRQCYQEGFQPKIISCAKAALFYIDVNAWGGNLPIGVFTEVWWAPEYQCTGIGDTTPQSLYERWHEATGDPLNRGIGHGYAPAQVLLDAIERAGSLDADAINKAIGETDMLMTFNYEVKFDPEWHFSWIPLFVGQWQKTDNPWVWECPIVFSKHDFLSPAAEPIFPRYCE